ncbi:hypothetical protein, partial [Methylobacterium hispanicum]|uniref:hypothetical protein n=1 Tax=Methylobacterium hispanicum TaxID=270350 RepID=UPI001EDD77E1
MPSADIVERVRRSSLEALPYVLEEVRILASERPGRHRTHLSALCWREVGAGPVARWLRGRLVFSSGAPDAPAADETALALPRRLDEVPCPVRHFMERIETLVADRRRVLALLGGVDLVVPVDPPSLRIPFEAEPAEIAAAAVAARALFLCGPWLPESLFEDETSGWIVEGVGGHEAGDAGKTAGRDIKAAG